MSKPVKDLMTRELSSRFADKDSALWVEFVGCDGVTSNQFRRALHARGMSIEIVKNALFKRAVAGTKLNRLGETVDGPAAMVTAKDSLIDAAKLVEEWFPKIPGLKLRAAVLEGEYIDERSIKGLSKMPTRRELQGQIAAAMRSPGGKLASAIRSPGARIAGAIKALMEKLEKSGGSAAPAEGAAPADAAAPTDAAAPAA